MKNTLIIVTIILFSVLSGCTRPILDFGYMDTDYGFGLDPPAGWIVDENESFDSVVRFYDDSEGVCLNISKPHQLDMGLALSVFADDIEETYPEMYDDFSVICRDFRDIDGLTAYEIIYSYTEDSVSFKVKQVAVLRTRTVFYLTLTATNETYDQYISLVDQSIDSFRII